MPRPAPLPGTRSSCALLTICTVLLAWPWAEASWTALVRPFYFGLLFWFFWRTSRAHPSLAGQAMRLVQTGFLVLWLSFTVVAVLHFAAPEPTPAALRYLREAGESGAMFLLGITLIAYGLMLWIPQVLASHRNLDRDVAVQRSALASVQSERSLLEQRLVDADRRGMLGELAATIAHDLRNPLTIVKGTAESLCRKPRTAAEVAEHTQVIRRNIDKADRTIAALIDLGRPRAARRERRAVRELLDEVHELVSVEARRRQLTVQVEAARGDDRAEFDRVLLAQALLNLVLNACQASQPHGTVTLQTRRFANGHGAAVACLVTDRGTGLPPDWRTRLFTPFFTTKPDGTGLGLSSCRRIAKELGASLRVYPRHRGGARAVLLLPAMPPVASEPAAWQSTEELVG